MLSHVPGLQTYNSKQPFSLVNGVAVQIYRQASKLTTSPGSLRLHIEITCDYITLQIYMSTSRPLFHSLYASRAEALTGCQSNVFRGDELLYPPTGRLSEFLR